MMNDKIRELAIQAGLTAPYGSEHEGLADFDWRKFAELLIKEEMSKNMNKLKRGIVIPFETADAITIATLKAQLRHLEQELEQHAAGEWMHPEDVANSQEKFIPALRLIIEYYGGDTDE